ncbi:YkgJ family cysteine cluster protein [Flavobacterium nackdongense]|uniref:YkgJ family cysteine cluster protein n=1 Tax=Flavobacterium nackdongense TaxID=2547394 RepID=A0A4V1AGM0_9FLAO|nr:YkgJ family cysteine cluster protein [Flavobacterium nackdongense]QBN18512.1 YkgJ family cysteine cluster protein [Flavobacterium nackdongense]
MAIEQKVRQVEALYSRLEKEITAFKSATNLHCLVGCGKCCSKPDIDASPLEFLPWAFHLFLNGKAEEVLLELDNSPITTCHIYRPLALLEEYNGSCSNYSYRGMICRLFGYAASRDKYAKLRLAICKIIKEDQLENFNSTEKLISDGLYVPIFTDYYMQLAQIDYQMGTILVPINEALKMAIEEVLHYYAYRPFPGGLENIA